MGAAMVLLVLAASAGPVRIWTSPPADVGSPSIDSADPLDTIARIDSVAPAHSDGQPWGAFLGQLLGAVLIAAAVTIVVWGVRSGLWAKPERRHVRQGRARLMPALPDEPEAELAVDADAARLALAEGAPRNAIVACWMQLERDAAAAGMPRAAAETSAEYVERVVAASSVDPGPIGRLAALYREARFSDHELGDEPRTLALAELNSVEAVLRHSVEVTA